MINYGQSPDNQTQLELPGVNDRARAIWNDAKIWTLTHFSEWSYYRANALKECELATDGKASPNLCLSDVRRRFHVEIPNAWAPALARMAMEEDPRLDFRLAKSMFDACASVKL